MSDLQSEVAQEVIRAARDGPPVAVATVIRAPEGSVPALGEKLLLRADGSRLGSLGGGDLEEAVAAEGHAAISSLPRTQLETVPYRADGTRLERLGTGRDEFQVMIEVTERRAALLIVGGGHIGQSLATFAAQAGLSVTVLEDRAAFADPDRFPLADRVICGDFAKELRRFPIDAHTYIVLVTRGHRQDELSLREVVASGAAYVGMIGSRRRVRTVLSHLAREGYGEEMLAGIHGPIGLDIGAETPEEIAVSIIAEIIAVRRGGSGRKLSEVRRGEIRE